MIAGTTALPPPGTWPSSVDLPAPTAPNLKRFTPSSGDTFTTLRLQGILPVTRQGLNALLDELYPRIAEDVSSKLFNASRADLQNLAALPLGSSLSDMVAYRVVSVPMTTSSVANLVGSGIEFLPDPAGFLFKNSNPTQWRILISGLRETGPSMAYKARTYYYTDIPPTVDINGLVTVPGQTTWTYVESEVQFGSFFSRAAGYPTTLKIVATTWRIWQDVVVYGVIGESGNGLWGAVPTDTLWPGFTPEAWTLQCADGTYLNTPSSSPVASGNALNDVLDRGTESLRVCLPPNLTAYFLAVQ